VRNWYKKKDYFLVTDIFVVKRGFLFGCPGSSPVPFGFAMLCPCCRLEEPEKGVERGGTIACTSGFWNLSC